MRIIYVHQYFKTPEEGGALRSYYIATALARAGHQVDMVTAHNGRHTTRRTVHGFTVHALPVSYDNRFGMVRRMLAFMLYVYRAIRLIKRLPVPDKLYVTSTPLTTGLIGLYFRRKKIPYVFEVRDLWPEAPFQMGYFRDPVSRRALLQLEKKIYRKAEFLIALSPAILRHVGAKAPETAVHLVPNMADCQFFVPPKSPLYTPEKDDSRFSIAYTGAIGVVNGLEHLLNAARACVQQDLPVAFHIAGDGAMAPVIRQRAKDLQLDNIRFYGHLPKRGVRELLSVCDAVYIGFATLPVLASNSPNKFFDGLAAGRICITNCRGWIQEEIETSDCGFYTDPGDPAAFARQLSHLLEQPRRIHLMQQNARTLAKEKYTRESLTEKLVSLVSGHGTGRALNRESAYTLTC